MHQPYFVVVAADNDRSKDLRPRSGSRQGRAARQPATGMDALVAAAGCDSSGGGNPLGNLVDGLMDRSRVAEQSAEGLVVTDSGAARPNLAAAASTMQLDSAHALGLFGAALQPEPEPEPHISPSTFQGRIVSEKEVFPRAQGQLELDFRAPMPALMQRTMAEAHRVELARMGRGAGLFRAHPTIERQGDLIMKRPGATKGWATAMLPGVMTCRPGGPRYFLDVTLAATSWQSNQLMVGICRPTFDPLAGAETDVGPDGALGAAFGALGWAYYCSNGSSYHDQPRGPEGADHFSKLGSTAPGGSFSVALDCGSGTLELWRGGGRVGQLASGLTGEFCFSTQLLHPDAAIQASITEPSRL